MIFKTPAKLLTITLLFIGLMALPAGAAKDPLAQWKPDFDPSGAKYTYLLSCVGHPAIEGVAAGFRIRDRIWQESNGQIYVDFRPLSQLGGEKDVINKLKLGAVQGMMSSSVAAANISPKLGIVNLPFVIDSFEKLDRFRITPELWEPFRDAPLQAGLQAIDFTGYGSYGWATTKPVRNLADARTVNFRIAQAPVNIDAYKAWGLKFTVLPWPDVPQALQTGVIDGLDHTPIVCNISKKFTIAKYYTELNYAQGLYVHIINRKWLNKLPEDLRTTFLKVVREESAEARKMTRQQQQEQIADAKQNGIEFISLSDQDRRTLEKKAAGIYEEWGQKIGESYLQEVRDTLQ
ncbi:MAG: C4-dicarboxylate ABC transporter substrate-binding protein [Desulfuromonas sp.]|nr:MAG: C4-dicarboxylate ABC transporter substrate-binding protein [Desulfuromonas sp.]